MIPPEFRGFPKLARLRRDCIITEKIDGTNAQIVITPQGDFFSGSRNRWITPEDDNYGFSTWAHTNRDELMKLGPGQHFGEWWGKGIQRNYGLETRKFSLFNALQWSDPIKRPACCDVVPTVGCYNMGDLTNVLGDITKKFEAIGSLAAPGFSKPEGVVIFHKASGQLFKVLFENDHISKTEAEAA